jgi:hypothetical protein
LSGGISTRPGQLGAPRFALAPSKGYDPSVSAKSDEKHDPAKPVATQEELEKLLLAGLESGEPHPVSEEDWERLRDRAAQGAEVRKSG